MMSELAQYAARSADSRGRFFEELASLDRDVYQRDRDRIIHSTALRRLKHKTQVFVYHEGDHYRTRLTHSLEVAQIARSIGRSLRLNEDLTEALALAHDLGHTPFGHAGEEALDMAMQPWGGFDHNAQTLRIVTRLERRYADFDGLNLSWETLEGLVKHNGPVIEEKGEPIGRYAETGIPAALSDFPQLDTLMLSSFASGEAQVAAIADDIAYNAHDIDDGLRAGVFDVIDLADIPIAGPALSEVLTSYPRIERGRMIHETVRRVISVMVADVVRETSRRLDRLAVSTPSDIRTAGEPVVAFSAQMLENNRVLQKFLFRRMYRHEKVVDIMERAKRVVRHLFDAYLADPSALPRAPGPERQVEDEHLRARNICDFVAGMTDRYAMDEHKRLFDLDPLFR
ncbi:MAG: deoxyguanosinetriphosphate triphosphohydrolase [Pseudomonadota bacterium]